jgi:glycosyltransferase involved in cell wall biosynthesis
MIPDALRGRLVLVISTLTHGGAEVQVKTLATAFVERGWRTDLVVLRRPEAFVDELAEADVPVHTLDVRRGASTPRALLKLARTLRRLRPDVVHSHMRGANILARLARPLARPPVLICTAHNFDENVSTRGIGARAELAYRLTDRLCDLTTNVSEAAVARYVATRAAPAHRIRFVPNGIEVEHFRRDETVRARMRRELGLDKRTTVLAIGRFQPQKNHNLLVRGFARALAHDSNAVLLLAGAGPLEFEIRQLVGLLGIDRSVRFLGVRNDVPALLAAADCYAMSSHYEGLPIVLLEAAAAGLPILATAVGGSPEIVEHRVNGLLVPSGDLEAFVAGLTQLLTMTPALRAAMGAAGRERVASDYAIDRVVDRWEAIYAEMLASKGHAPGRERT